MSHDALNVILGFSNNQIFVIFCIFRLLNSRTKCQLDGSKNIRIGNYLQNSQIGGTLTPSLLLRPGTPPVSSPSTMSFDLCDAVNATDQPHDRPCSHSHPARWPTICHRAQRPWAAKGPTPLHPYPTLALSQGPLALPNAATVAPRGPLTGTKWTATYPP